MALKPKTLPTREVSTLTTLPSSKRSSGIGDEGVEAAVVAGHVLDPVGAALVVLEVGEQVGPHRRPRARRALGGHGGGRLLAGHPVLGRDLEAGEEVGVLRFVLRLPVGLSVVLDAGVVGGHVLVSSRWFSGCRTSGPTGRARPSGSARPSRPVGTTVIEGARPAAPNCSKRSRHRSSMAVMAGPQNLRGSNSPGSVTACRRMAEAMARRQSVSMLILRTPWRIPSWISSTGTPQVWVISPPQLLKASWRSWGTEDEPCITRWVSRQAFVDGADDRHGQGLAVGTVTELVGAVGGAHGDGQGVDPGGAHERHRLVGIGQQLLALQHRPRPRDRPPALRRRCPAGPAQPSSPSTDTPRAWASSVTRRVMATFSS